MRAPTLGPAWRLLAALVVGAALGVLPLLFVASRTIDFAAHQRNVEALGRMAAADADLDHAVVGLRHGQVLTYDPAVAALAALRREHDAVDLGAYRLEAADRGRLAALHAEAGRRLAEKSEAVEDFKSANAALRNSLSYLPAVADDLLAAGRAGALPADVAEEVRSLREAILMFGLDLAGVREAAVATLVGELREARGRLATTGTDPATLTALDSLLAHAEVVYRTQALVGALVDVIRAEHLRGAVDRLDTVLGEAANTLVATADRYRRGLVALAALLAAAGLAAVLRLWVVARRLDGTVQALGRQQQALVEARDRAQAAARAKATFLANMSHELRTPLNAITGYSELLLEECACHQGDPALVADLERIRDAGGRLLALVNDVLELARIEAGRAEPAIVTADAHGLVEALAREHRGAVEANGSTLELAAEPGLGAVRTDPAKLRQAAGNLLANAARFTRDGKVTLRAWREGEGAGAQLAVAVEDSGIGMSEAEIARALDSFDGLAPTVETRGGPSGLGLAIARRLAEQLGGALSITSMPGRGTTATLRIAAELGAPAAANLPVAPRQGAATVLLIDDDPEIQATLGTGLEAAGFRVIGATDGEAGLAAARNARPDAILLDVVMPGMDGWSVLRALKADPELARVPVVMLTIMENAELGLALGAAAYLRKPAGADTIAAAVRRHAGPGGRDVLVVDDDARSREVVGRILRRQGVRVSEAVDGAAALAWLERNPPPAVMILDLAMPPPDGFAVVERLAADARWRDIPVVVLTAKDLTPHEVGALGGHVRRIFQKGRLPRGELVRVVQEELRMSRVAG